MTNGHRVWLISMTVSAALVALVGLGLMAEVSATWPGRVQPGRHAALLALSVVAGVVAAGAVDPNRAGRWAGLAAVALVGAMVLTLLPHIGVEIRGARRHIAIGPVCWMPGSLAAVAVVLTVASGFSATASRRRRALAGAVTALAAAAHVMQPHFGNLAVMVGGVAGALLGSSGSRRRMVAVSAAVLLVALTALAFPYVQHRVRLWIDPRQNQDTAALTAIREQSTWLGTSAAAPKGWRLSSPESDYALAFVLYRHGWVGVVVIDGLLVVLVAGMLGARAAADGPLTRSALAALAGLVGTATLIHSLVSLGLMPVTGMYLPLVSAGGSTLTATGVTVGAALGLARTASKG